MRIGIMGGDAGGDGTLDAMVAAARTAEEQGFASYWSSQIFGVDALTALAVIGREVPRIELGTAVVPTYPRHPMALAAQALTVQAATGNRLALGIGLSHQIVVEGMWGMSFDRPLRHMREYLAILAPLLRGEAVSESGETLTFRGAVQVPGVEPPSLLVAALGPKMLELAGTVADGTATWMTGARTIERHVAPTLRAAADAAGRPAPRIVAGIPVCVTADPDAARTRAAKAFEVYGTLPSYRAMLDREGVDGPADLAVVGDEAAVTAQLGRFADAGATELAAVEFAAGDDRRRTRDLLCTLL